VVIITTPVEGDDFFGEPALIDVNLEATDDLSGVARLWLSINGEARPPVEAAAPYAIEQVSVPAGEHTLVAFAEHFAGNVGMSPAIVFAVAAGEEEGGTGGDGGSVGMARADAGATSRSCPRDRAPPRAWCSSSGAGPHAGAGVPRRARSPCGCEGPPLAEEPVVRGGPVTAPAATSTTARASIV